MIGVRCTTFFFFFLMYLAYCSNSVAGWSLIQLRFLSNFLASCFNRSSLHEFL